MTSGPGRLPDPAVSPDEFRWAMSQFATGVTIISGLDPAGEPVGFACQSFCSVSLQPPLVLFCADHRGRSWPRLRDHGAFTANVLAHDQDELVRRFGLPLGRKFRGIDWQPGPLGTPTLPQTICQVHCQIVSVTVAGDHDVVLGRVVEVSAGPPSTPMIYHRGEFARLADEHGPHTERDDL